MCIGYDCGCKTAKTVSRSPLGPLAKSHFLKFVVGLFHGHAHNRLCQLFNLPTYVEGMGLENFEGCERLFSKSNALAAVVRHSSSFHRHQAIRSYFEHMDEIETFQGLSTFLYNNTKHALEELQAKDELLRLMRDNEWETTAIFAEWLAEERQYLSTLQKEPADESLRLEYFKALKDLRKCE